MVELATPCSHPVFHPVNFLLLQSGQIEPTSCCFTTRFCLQFVLFFNQAGVRSDFRQFWGDPVRTNSGWWFGVLVDWKSSTNLNSDAALGYGDKIRDQHDFSSNSACKSNLEFSPNICSNTKSNSAIPAKLASASLFAGQFRGDSTLIQTQFGFLISLPYPQSNLQSD